MGIVKDVKRFYRTNKKVLVLLIVAVLCVLSFLVVLRAASAPPSLLNAQTLSNTNTSASSTVNVEIPRALLDGLPLGDTTSTQHMRPFSVMVENSPEARPLSGIAHASLVFEAPVEGGITRLLAVFDPSRDVSQIGPVRSARPYYLDWAQELDAVYAHVGGSPDALDLLKKSNIHNLDEFFNGNNFWRSSDRVAPHNTYTSITLLTQVLNDRLWNSEPRTTSWMFADVATSTPQDATSATLITVPFSSVGYEVVWKWNADTKMYDRRIGGSVAKDLDGAVERAKNIAVVYVGTKVLDDKGRLSMTSIGKGKAIIFEDGLQIPAEWRKSTSKDRLRFYDSLGNEIVWRPGTTWVEVVPKENTVTVK